MIIEQKESFQTQNDIDGGGWHDSHGTMVDENKHVSIAYITGRASPYVRQYVQIQDIQSTVNIKLIPLSILFLTTQLAFQTQTDASSGRDSTHGTRSYLHRFRAQ